MSGDKTQERVQRILARARELRDSDAFAPARREDLLPVSAKQAKEAALAGTRKARRVVLTFVIVCTAMVVFSLLLPYAGFDAMRESGVVYNPTDVLDCYALWFKTHIGPLFDASLSNRAGIMQAEFSQTHSSVEYDLVMNRVTVTGIVVLCGIMLALSGLLFQTAFRNPMATPSSLGVSDGVTLGTIIFSSLGFNSISDNPVMYVALVYGLGVVTVAAVLILSRGISGGARYNVLDMLLLGTVVCQLVGGVNGYVQNFMMGYDTWYNFYDVQQASNALVEPVVCAVVVMVFAITFAPALILRFRLNLIAFSNDEGEMMGVRASIMRIMALVLGSAMQLAAIASVGQVAMLSLAVPFVVRYALPADFRWQFLGNCLMGTTVLLACVAIQNFALFGTVLMPVGTIVSLFIIPFFVWMVAFGRGRW